jgi:preprotein translocase subunit SecF
VAEPTEGGNSTQPRQMGRMTKLYLGTGAFNIVGKRKIWYVVTGVILLVCLGSIIFKGFTPSIEFVGGTKIHMPATSVEGTITADQAKRVYADTLGHDPVAAQEVGSGSDAAVEIRSETLTNAEVSELKDALFDELQPVNNDGQPDRASISDRGLSGSWGGEITQQALIALAVFLVLVSAFLAFYFERWMAVAALAALGFDLTVSAGVYSIVGFEVTPSTVIGLLTILGFSLYDTVVVFDKVRENTKGLVNLSRQTYPEAANLALNQTLMRSINTQIVSLLPVLGLLVIGAGLLGAGTLKDLALVMTVGTLSGTLSSIFLATPVLVDLKMRESAYQDQARRVESRRALGKRTASQQAGAEDGLSTVDDEALDAELRQEKAYAAASSVPGRNLKKVDQRRVAGKPSGKSSAGKRTGKPSGKPTGKRKR